MTSQQTVDPKETLQTSGVSQSLKEPSLSKSTRKPNNRRGRIAPIIPFFLGILVSMIALSVFIFFAGLDRTPVATPSSTQIGTFGIQMSDTYMTQIMGKKLGPSGIPGKISKVHIDLPQNGMLVISADDALRLAGIPVIRRFSITLQPYIRSCQLQMHVIHTEFSGIPVTNFAANYENAMNQAVQLKASSLPGGFTYCAAGVRTNPQTLFITYSTASVQDR